MLSIGSKMAAVTVSVLAATMGGTATAQMPSSPAQEPAQEKASVGISILPGIIGPGNGVQGSGSAKWAVIGKYDSSKEGKKVVLQRRSGRVQLGGCRQGQDRQEGSYRLRRSQAVQREPGELPR